VLTLNRPAQRNALNAALVRELLQALRGADADPTVRALVVTGAGSVFSAGADLREFAADPPDSPAVAQRAQLFADLQSVFSEIAVPTIAAVNGPAVGAGASLAIAADLTLLSPQAALSYPEVRHGMVPGLMIPVLSARVGPKHAYELLATAAALDATTACRLGLANAVVAAEALLPRALDQAHTLASMEREVLRQTKQLMVALQGLPLRQAVAEATRQTLGPPQPPSPPARDPSP